MASNSDIGNNEIPETDHETYQGKGKHENSKDTMASMEGRLQKIVDVLNSLKEEVKDVKQRIEDGEDSFCEEFSMMVNRAVVPCVEREGVVALKMEELKGQVAGLKRELAASVMVLEMGELKGCR